MNTLNQTLKAIQQTKQYYKNQLKQTMDPEQRTIIQEKINLLNTEENRILTQLTQ